MTVAHKENQSTTSVNAPPSLSYPFKWDGLEDFNYPGDDRGIPKVNAGGRFGLCYNPITIAQYGLFCLQRYAESNDEEGLEKAKSTANWLVENFREWKNEIGAWVFDYDLEFYGPKAPWISGMAQGQGISLLLRFQQLSSVKDVPEITHRAFKAFLHPVSEGGVVSHFPDGALVFEEFPTEPPSLVLNGHMFALLGIYDYATYWQDKAAKDLFGVAINGLRQNLERYDIGFWNLYDLHPTHRLASPMYVKAHVQLLTILAELSGQLIFRDTATKWQAYLDSPVCRVRWLFGKILEKIRLRF